MVFTGRSELLGPAPRRGRRSPGRRSGLYVAVRACMLVFYRRCPQAAKAMHSVTLLSISAVQIRQSVHCLKLGSPPRRAARSSRADVGAPPPHVARPAAGNCSSRLRGAAVTDERPSSVAVRRRCGLTERVEAATDAAPSASSTCDSIWRRCGRCRAPSARPADAIAAPSPTAPAAAAHLDGSSRRHHPPARRYVGVVLDAASARPSTKRCCRATPPSRANAPHASFEPQKTEWLLLLGTRTLAPPFEAPDARPRSRWRSSRPRFQLFDGRTPHTISTAGVEAVYSNSSWGQSEKTEKSRSYLTGEVAVAVQPSAAAAKARRRVVADAEEATKLCRRTRRSCDGSRWRGSTTGSLLTTTGRSRFSRRRPRRRTRAPRTAHSRSSGACGATTGPSRTRSSRATGCARPRWGCG